MNFPRNIYSVNSNEIEQILADVAEQIGDPNSNKNFGKDVVARIRSYRGYEGRPSNSSRSAVLYHKDAILRAVHTIKEHGWYVWGHDDYEGVLSVWVTRSCIRPHDWYSAM